MGEFLFLMSAAAVAYSYAGFPLVVAVAAWLLPRAGVQKSDEYVPPVTLVISAYNEETVIQAKLRNSLDLDYPTGRLEIFVASESTDGTNDIVRRYERFDIRLRAFDGRLGKSATLFRVVPDANGEVIVFSDANALYDPDAIRKIVRNFCDPRVGAVVGQLNYTSATNSIGSRGERMYWLYDRWFRRHANVIPGLVPGVNGSIFAIRKDLYLPFGLERGDDYELCTRIAIRGYRVVLESAAIAKEKASENVEQQFRRKVRLVRWNLMSSLLLLRESLTHRAWVVALQVLSQRLLRYLAPFCLLTAAIASLLLASESAFYAVVAVAQAAFYITGGIGWLAEKRGVQLPLICLLPSYFLMVNTAAMVGVVSGILNGQATVWQKVR